MQDLKISVGVWYLGATSDRFVKQGYRPDRTMEERFKLASSIPGAGGLEMHYPTEVTDENYKSLKQLADDLAPLADEAVEPRPPLPRPGGRGVVRQAPPRVHGGPLEGAQGAETVDEVPVLEPSVAAVGPRRNPEPLRPGGEEAGRRRGDEVGVEPRQGLLVARRVDVRPRAVPEHVGDRHRTQKRRAWIWR